MRGHDVYDDVEILPKLQHFHGTVMLMRPHGASQNSGVRTFYVLFDPLL